MINWQMFSVFFLAVSAVTILGFWAGRWRSGNLNRLQEWGLGGRRFGTIVYWFLMGGDIYTAQSFIALPALLFAQGAIGFYIVPYAGIMYIFAFLILPRFWIISRHRGYITAADFVHERFDSKLLALAIAITGILSLMPYMALQMLAIQISLALMGLPVEISLITAFAIMAGYTYVSGLRAPAMISVVKDTLIWVVALAALIMASLRFGGFDHIFAAVPKEHLLLSPKLYSTYVTLIIGSSLALFLYPHNMTSTLSANSHKVVKRNTVFLLAYTMLIGMITLLGYVALAAGVKPSPVYKTSIAFPAVFTTLFPSWFAGFALAALSIGALVPAAIMSIATANLFTRNIYREYFHPACTEREEARVARLFSLLIKVGALVFLLLVPITLANNLQLLAGVWILQTLPAVFLGLYTNWFHRWALIIGWICGMAVGTSLVIAQQFSSQVFPLPLGSMTIPIYTGLLGLIVNLFCSIVLTPILHAIGVSSGHTVISEADFDEQPVVQPVMGDGMVQYDQKNMPAFSPLPQQATNGASSPLAQQEKAAVVFNAPQTRDKNISTWA